MKRLPNSSASSKKQLSYLLIGALFFWAASAASYWQGRECLLGAVPSLVIFAAGATGIVACKKLLTSRTIPCAIAGIMAGFLIGTVGASHAIASIEEFEHEGANQQVVMEMLEDTKQGSYGSYGVARVFADNSKCYKVKAYFPSQDRHFYGERIEAMVRYSATKETSFDANWAKGIIGTVHVETLNESTWLNIFAERRAQFLLSQIDEPVTEGSALLCALANGYKADLVQLPLYTSFQATGLAHVVAVSGAHLSIVCGLAGAFLSRMRISRKARTVAQVAFITMYLICSGVPISAFRAAVMCTASLCSFYANRRGAPQNALGICIFAFIAYEPSQALSVSFALSALSTLGIIVFSKDISRALDNLFKGRAKLVRDALSLTLASSITTLGVSAALFSQVSLVVLLSNAVCALFFTPLCAACVLCSLFCMVGVPGGDVLVFVSETLCNCAISVISALSHVPFACVPVCISLPCALFVSAALFVAFLAIPMTGLKKLMKFACIGVFIVLAGNTVRVMATPSQLIALDVGQGDAILIHNGSADALVDTGMNASQLKRQLALQGVMQLDYVFITHPDNDHCGALEQLLATVDVSAVVVSRDLLECECNKCNELRQSVDNQEVPLYGVRVGDTVTLNSTTITVISPESFHDQGGNQDSLCLLATFIVENDTVSQYSALLVGDAEAETLENLSAQNLLRDVDIFKVGHHGSASSCSDKLLSQISPQLALISVGEGNRYGHPTSEALTALSNNDCPAFRTDEQGAIMCSFTREGILIQTER